MGYDDVKYNKYSCDETIEVKECLAITDWTFKEEEWGLFVDVINNKAWWYHRKTHESRPYKGEESNPNITKE